MKLNSAVIVAGLLAMTSNLAYAEDGDPTAGEKVFKKCKACHTATEEKNKVGPYLLGVVGRKAASVDGFKYSKALSDKAPKIGTWDQEKIVEYVADPKAYIGGKSKMIFKLKDEQQRKDVAAYLASLSQ